MKKSEFKKHLFSLKKKTSTLFKGFIRQKR